MKSGLYIIPTPLGNLGDITMRAVDTLKKVDLIACEDTRHSQKLLSHYEIRKPLIRYHDHSSENDRNRILDQLTQGKSIALISDAGTPLIADPGYKLVKACRDQGISVTPLPGPNAAITALSASGLPTDRFFFVGFLPSQKQKKLAELQKLQKLEATFVFYESANRLTDTLTVIKECYGDLNVSVARELTKMYEEIRTAPVDEILEYYLAQPPRGEIVLLVENRGEMAHSLSDDDLKDRLQALINSGLSVKQAVANITAETGFARKQIYALALTLTSSEK